MGATPPGTAPNGHPKKSIFFERLNLECQSVLISAEKYCDIVWGCHPPPPRGPRKSIFYLAQLRVPVLYDISRDLTDKYFGVVWGCHPPGNPPKNQFFKSAQARVPVFYDIRGYLTDKYFDSSFLEVP